MQYQARPLFLYLSLLTKSMHYTPTEGGYSSSSPLLACDILVAIDSTLYKHYKEDPDVVKHISQNLVNGINDIYHRTVFIGEFSNIYFRLRNIEVLYDFCNHCNQTQKEFLSLFSKFNYHEYCIAILFTYRDFPAGLAGLAWRGTACSQTHNTGFITFLNNDQESDEKDNVITLAHEVGHLLGATHVDGTVCGEREDYIMSPTGTNNVYPVFSQCSIEAIHKVLIEKKFVGCFKEEEFVEDVGFCGNGVVEGLEQCDCGMKYEKCWDPCCTAGHVSPSDRYWNESARPCQLNNKKICSKPYQVLANFGVIGPAIFICTSCILITSLLCWNWRGTKSLFKHHYASSRRKSATSSGNIRTKKSLSSHESLSISQPFLVSTTADITNTKTCSRISKKSRNSNNTSNSQNENTRPIIKTKNNPLISSHNTLSSQANVKKKQGYSVTEQAATSDKHESTSFIISPLSGTRGGKESQSWPINKAPVSNVSPLVNVEAVTSQSPLSGSSQALKNKEGYNPIPRRSAPPPKFNQNSSLSESQHVSKNNTPLVETPAKTFSSSLTGEIHSKESSGEKAYDPKPRRSAPRPPTK